MTNLQVSRDTCDAHKANVWWSQVKSSLGSLSPHTSPRHAHQSRSGATTNGSNERVNNKSALQLFSRYAKRSAVGHDKTFDEIHEASQDMTFQEFVMFAKEEHLLGPNGFNKDILKRVFNNCQKDNHRSTLTFHEFLTGIQDGLDTLQETQEETPDPTNLSKRTLRLAKLVNHFLYTSRPLSPRGGSWFKGSPRSPRSSRPPPQERAGLGDTRSSAAIPDDSRQDSEEDFTPTSGLKCVNSWVEQRMEAEKKSQGSEAPKELPKGPTLHCEKEEVEGQRACERCIALQEMLSNTMLLHQSDKHELEQTVSQLRDKLLEKLRQNGEPALKQQVNQLEKDRQKMLQKLEITQAERDYAVKEKQTIAVSMQQLQQRLNRMEDEATRPQHASDLQNELKAQMEDLRAAANNGQINSVTQSKEIEQIIDTISPAINGKYVLRYLKDLQLERDTALDERDTALDRLSQCQKQARGNRSSVEAQLQAENDALKKACSSMRIDHSELTKDHQQQEARIAQFEKNRSNTDADSLIEELQQTLQQERARCASIEQRLSRWEKLGLAEQDSVTQLEQALALECAWSQSLKQGLQALSRESFGSLSRQSTAQDSAAGSRPQWSPSPENQAKAIRRATHGAGFEQLESEVADLSQSLQDGDPSVAKDLEVRVHHLNQSIQHAKDDILRQSMEQVDGLGGQVKSLAALLANRDAWCDELSEISKGDNSGALCDRLDRLSSNLATMQQSLTPTRDQEVVVLMNSLRERDDRINELEGMAARYEHSLDCLHQERTKFRVLASIDNELLSYCASGAFVKPIKKQGDGLNFSMDDVILDPISSRFD